MDAKEKSKIHQGHRQRILSKLATEETLKDHELLEILLFYVIPRKNTNETAHELISACNGLGNVFHADMNTLCSVEGIGNASARFLKTVGALYDRIRKDGLMEALQMMYSCADFSKYITEKYKNSKEEVLEFYAIDEKSRICFVRAFHANEKDRIKEATQDVTSFIADYRPRGLVVSHNHPDTFANPTAEDDELTRLLYILCGLNNVQFIDHVIVGKNTLYSYFLTGALDKIKHSPDMYPLLNRGR